MSFFKIKIEEQNEKYKSILEDFNLQQNLMNDIFNQLENFAKNNSNEQILIQLSTKNDITEINDINELSLQFWFRFNIMIDSYTAYIILSEDNNGIHILNHQKLKLLLPTLLIIYEHFNIESIISQFETFVKTAQKIKKIQKDILNEEFRFKSEYVKHFLKNNFLDKNNTKKIHFCFQKSTKNKSFERYFGFNTGNPFFSINVPEEHNEFSFSNKKYSLDDFKKINQEIFDFFPDNFFYILFLKKNNPFFNIECNSIDIEYLYQKAKTYTDIKDF